MNGRILAAEHEGAYALKMVGDVRVSLCSTIDDYLERMFSAPDFDSVVVDLCSAEGIDSTTLGLLARLALRAREQYSFKPVIYSCDAGINRLLQSMAFGKLFDIRHETCDEPDHIAEVPTVAGDEAAVKAKVIEAHRALMDLSEENRQRFEDLMVVLQES
ncbi:anti-anti-sigma factor [Halieaceae bacterium IMCC14734]|uniref:Anti-anti-sigma factor n=1 Tax=Candidatus Litorirhabdus singularis TaxID=2518993 RepID=A0ABT3TIC4_9GAMM|nr:anti-anti-sigma factor [Candidatus Litorirhabdus singularis]MCX2982075.1 anti-anti-sigma factor [Candidatus Litorirhabdus singularis]